MKKTLQLIGLALLASVTIVQAQVRPVPGFSVGALSVNQTNTYNGTNYVVVDTPASGYLSGNYFADTPSVSYINAQSDLATAKLVAYATAYPNGNAVVVTNSTTSVYVNSTNGIAVNQPIVINHALAGYAEPRFVTAIANYATNSVISPLFPYSTNTTYQYTLTVNAAPNLAVIPGDNVTGYLPQSQIAWGASTNSVQGPNLIVGQFQVPLLLSINFTTSGSINTASGVFQ